jgi:hypothetical protein
MVRFHVPRTSSRKLTRPCQGSGSARARSARARRWAYQSQNRFLDELLLGEVAVQGGVSDPGAAGDFDQADAQSVLGERLGGGGEDPVAVLAGIATQAAPPRPMSSPHRALSTFRTGYPVAVNCLFSDEHPPLTCADSVSCSRGPEIMTKKLIGIPRPG